MEGKEDRGREEEEEEGGRKAGGQSVSQSASKREREREPGLFVLFVSGEVHSHLVRV